jgi:hypothetical protein
MVKMIFRIVPIVLLSCTDFGNDVNVIDLCPGGVAASVQFFHDLVQALIGQGAHLDAIFSYELRNESYYDSNQDPLDWTSGMVTPADGQTYDMSSAASQQQMMDNGLIQARYWTAKQGG